MQEFENIVGTAYWIVLGAILLLLIGRFIYFIKTRDKRISIQHEKKIYRLFRYATIVVLPLFIFGIVSFVFVLQKGNMFAPTWMKNTLLVLLALLLITEVYYNIRLLSKRGNRILNVLFLILISGIGFYLNYLYLHAKSYPAVEDSVVVDLPFAGKWIATGAGATGLTNHHDRIKSQKYAVDISRVGEQGKLFTGAGVEKEESNTYGAEVLSPVKGKVVHTVDTLPDHPIRERDKLAGNHVIIQFQDSLYVALAHLQPNSIPVKVGDQVAVGQAIGKVGLSGNTDFCHLHIHVQDGPIYDIEHTKTYPIRFRSFRRKRFAFWTEGSDSYLLSNDLVEK